MTVPPVPPPAGEWRPPVDDPLVPRPEEGFEGWVRRTVATFRRDVGSTLALLAISTLLPTVVLSVASGYVNAYAAVVQDRTRVQPDRALADLPVLLGMVGLLVLLSVLLGYLSSVGWAGVLHLMARRAAGQPVGLAGSLRYGLRRGLPLWGWYILVTLCVLVGFCACVLPGVYLAVALSLIAPVVVFEPGESAFTRSFRLVHARFLPTVGRVLLLTACVAVYAVLTSTVVGVLTGASPVVPTSVVDVNVLSVVADGVLVGLLGLPASLVEIAGLLVLYAELRSREVPLTSADLAAAAA